MVVLDHRDARPLYLQVKDSLRRMMLTGLLAPGEKLPSVRALATQLAINPNTIQRAYGELETEGYVYSVSGRGSFLICSRCRSGILLCLARTETWQVGRVGGTLFCCSLLYNALLREGCRSHVCTDDAENYHCAGEGPCGFLDEVCCLTHTEHGIAACETGREAAAFRFLNENDGYHHDSGNDDEDYE